MKRLVRQTPRGGLQLRVAGDGAEGQFDALVLNYNVVDDYNTTFVPGVFTKSLKARLPRICWSHDWSEPIGRVISFEDDDKSLRITAQLDDFGAVPMARRAWAQMDSGTIDQFSVGFWMQAYDMPKDEGAPIAIKRGQLDEVSPVLVGAVPKTKLLAVRSRLLRVGLADGTEAMLPVHFAGEILTQLATGEIDLAEALTALKGAVVEPPDDAIDPPDLHLNDHPEKTPEELEAEAAEAQRLVDEAAAAAELADKTIELEDLAAIDEALSLVGR